MLRLTSDAGALLTETPEFRAAAPEILRSVQLDAMTAIYDRRSGMTHVVAPIVPFILDALETQAMSIDVLAERLDITDYRDGLSDRLVELVTTGLVDRQ